MQRNELYTCQFRTGIRESGCAEQYNLSMELLQGSGFDRAARVAALRRCRKQLLETAVAELRSQSDGSRILAMVHEGCARSSSGIGVSFLRAA